MAGGFWGGLIALLILVRVSFSFACVVDGVGDDEMVMKGDDDSTRSAFCMIAWPRQVVCKLVELFEERPTLLYPW